jgi:diguanylate cyclase (GGDEF)-like protein
LVDRVAYMWFLRLALAVLVVLLRVIVPKAMTGDVGVLALGTAAYLGVSLGLQRAWQALHRRDGGLVLFGAALLIDGAYLAWASYLSGGTSSPLRYLFLLHLIGVALLASYRTGLKVAAWDSLAVFAAFHLERARVLRPATAPLGSEYQQLVAFIAICWLVTLVAAAFSAVNERELRRRRFDLEALARMAAELEVVTDPVAIAGAALGNVVDAFGFGRAMLLAARGEGDLGVMAGHGVDVLAGTRCTMTADSIVRRAIATHQSLLESGIDPSCDAWLASALPSATNVIVTPLSADGSPFGALVLEHGFRGGSLVEHRVVAMVERFASYAALALRNGWLLEQVTRSAATDGLTGIANRRSFDVALSRELARAGRASEPVSLLMVDVDLFKALNDAHGHQTGDEVLRQVARIIAGNSREFDTTARYGGEEFAVILPSCGATESIEIADRLRRLVQGAETPVPVTISAGVATFPVDAPDAVTLIGAADMALYDSKRGGRNRVTSASKLDEPAVHPGPTRGQAPDSTSDWLSTPII